MHTIRSVSTVTKWKKKKKRPITSLHLLHFHLERPKCALNGCRLTKLKSICLSIGDARGSSSKIILRTKKKMALLRPRSLTPVNRPTNLHRVDFRQSHKKETVHFYDQQTKLVRAPLAIKQSSYRRPAKQLPSITSNLLLWLQQVEAFSLKSTTIVPSSLTMESAVFPPPPVPSQKVAVALLLAVMRPAATP